MTERPVGIADTDVYITRAFDAPRDLVWRFWTEPELLALWFGPVGVHAPAEKISVDMRVGGHWNVTMVDDETGAEYPIRSVLLEVEQPSLFAGRADADTSEGPLGDVRLRVELHDHGAKTRVTLHQGPFTAEQRDMTAAGWNDSFIKMDTAIEGIPA